MPPAPAYAASVPARQATAPQGAAASPAEQAEEAADPNWNVGAGIAFGDDTVLVLGDVGSLVFSARWTKLHRIQIVDELPKGTDTSNRLVSLRFAPAIDLRFYF